MIDLIEQFGGEETDVVLERLERQVSLSKVVPEHGAQGAVLVREIMQPVIVDIQIQAHHAADEDRPQAHARPPIGLAHRRRYPRFEQLKQRTTQRQIGVDVLQAAQYLRMSSRDRGSR